MRYHLFLFTIVASSFFSVSHACDCTDSIAIKKALRKNDVVFEGKVLSRNYLIVTDIGTYQVDSLRIQNKTTSIKQIITRYEVALGKAWKGRVEKNKSIIIYTSTYNGQCGYTFEINRCYIIYAKKSAYPLLYTNTDLPEENALWVQRCSRTTPYIERESYLIEKSKS